MIFRNSEVLYLYIHTLMCFLFIYFSNESKKQVIVVSLPGEVDVQYLRNLQHIADFIMEMDVKTKGRDHMIIVHDKSAWKYFKEYKFTNAHLIEVPVNDGLDMWMRDFPPAMPKQQIKFKYKPQYLTSKLAARDEENFYKFAKMVGLPDFKKSDLVYESGNIVENGADMAITSARAYKDNPGMTKDKLVKTLESTINRKVAVIPDPEDTTGHADGIVSFVEKNVLLISLFDDAEAQDLYDEIEKAVLDVFPKLEVVPLPSYFIPEKIQGFSSAAGSYANSLVTYNAVYLPFFNNQTSNQRAFEVFKNSTTKEVIPVYKTAEIPVLGGSLRCMTWQIDQDHPVAKRLFEYVKTNGCPNILCSGQTAFFAVLLHIVYHLYQD